ncbi:hypothetical protein F5B21DRAFT_525536 [Xylaria acuta]|nr:hypothetical protein F5B21DRAFT_525536 [Xylaria acuta]
MTLHPNLARGLRGRRRIIILPDNRPQEPHPTNRPGGARSLTTNLIESIPVTPVRRRPNTGRGIPHHQTRNSITPSSSFGIHSVYQSSPAHTGHTGSANYLEPPQSVYNYTPISRQGPMTVRNEGSSYPQMTPYSSAPPSIVVESHDQQQVLHPGPSLSQSGRGQLSPSALEAFNQYPSGISQQRNNTQVQPPSDLLPLFIPELGVPVMASIDKLPLNSWIYSDTLRRAINRPDWENVISPWPPGHTAFTRAGFDPKGGKCIQLTLRNGDRQEVNLALAVLDREQVPKADIRGVDVVLCQNYFWALGTRQTMPMGIERQMGGMGYPNAGYQLHLPGQSQNAINAAETLGYGYDSPTWLTPSSQTEDVQMHPQHLLPSLPCTVFSNSGGSSAAQVSSTTTPEVPVPMGETAAHYQGTHSNMPWQQLDKPGA